MFAVGLSFLSQREKAECWLEGEAAMGGWDLAVENWSSSGAEGWKAVGDVQFEVCGTLASPPSHFHFEWTVSRD